MAILEPFTSRYYIFFVSVRSHYLIQLCLSTILKNVIQYVCDLRDGPLVGWRTFPDMLEHFLPGYINFKVLAGLPKPPEEQQQMKVCRQLRPTRPRDTQPRLHTTALTDGPYYYWKLIQALSSVSLEIVGGAGGGLMAPATCTLFIHVKGNVQTFIMKCNKWKIHGSSPPFMRSP